MHTNLLFCPDTQSIAGFCEAGCICACSTCQMCLRSTAVLSESMLLYHRGAAAAALLHSLCGRNAPGASCLHSASGLAKMYYRLFLQAKKALERALRDDQYLQGIGQQLEVQVHEKAAYSIHT